MHLLSRICLQNWYLVDAIDIEIQGATALVGPTGAGKSSIADAIQTVLTGANMNRLNLNPSASGKSSRSVLEYCLGMTKDPADGGKPLRSSCETVLALVFRDEETSEPMTVGIAMSARSGDSREEILSRFIVPNFAYSVGDAKRRSDGAETIAPWAEIANNLRSMSPEFEEYRSSAEKFTTDMLKRMRGANNQAPNARHFLRSLSNALAFKPIFDPTVFVREYVLEPDLLDIERVRTSIDTWKHLEAVIEQIEAKLKRVMRLEGRFGTWANAKVKSGEARFIAAQAEMRRTVHEYKIASETYVAKNTSLQQTQMALATRRQWINELDEEIRTKKMLADAGEGGTRARHIEMERRLEDREASVRADRYQKIRQALSMIARLQPIASSLTPRQKRCIDAATEALRLLPDATDPANALAGKGEHLQELVDEITSSAGLDEIINTLADQKSDELREMQSRAEHLETAVGNSGSQRAVLSSSTSRLLGTLDRHGIEAIPLCDVVEVIDQGWQYAIESLLGRGREALIISPDLLKKAYDIMCSEDTYRDSMLVKTSVTGSKIYSIPKGSVLEAIKTDNEHALAFMNVRIGSFLRADSYEQLDKMDRGVMRDGRTSSGMGLTMQRKVHNLILGKAAREQTGEMLRNELGPLLERLNQARLEVRMLREAARVLGPSMDVLIDGESLFDLEHSTRASQNKIKALTEELNREDGGVTSGIQEEVASLEKDRSAYLDEIEEEYQPDLDRLLKEAARAEAKVQTSREALGKAIKDRKQAWEALNDTSYREIIALAPSMSDFDPIAILKRTRRTINDAEFEREDIRGYLAGLRNDNKIIADQSERDAAREQNSAIREFAEYSANWEIDVPRIDSETMATGYAWVLEERVKLEENELRKHKEACLNAANEMRRMLREDLLARLAEKLSKVHQRLDALNSHLKRHKFTGQTYSFSWDINGRFAKMYELAMKVGKPEGDPIEIDGQIDDALGELEDLIAGKDGAETLADYRQYFVFEIIMEDRTGGRTTMSSRAVKGSGGEAQAPFYVAIAASLASAYFPGHTQGTPTGMGLAMFDEAFNKLDVVNTQALLTFFKAMGLQLLIAGPEDKRATYTEVLDTIILVNKSLDGNSVYIDAEFPGDAARKALEEINPDHLGVEAFAVATPQK